MNKDKMVKVRLLNDGGFLDLKHISFPVDVAATDGETNGVLVHQTEFDVICSSPSMDGMYWFGASEYELITEEEPAPAPQQQTIEQLLKDLNALTGKQNEIIREQNKIRTELKSRIAPLGFDIIVKE